MKIKGQYIDLAKGKMFLEVSSLETHTQKNKQTHYLLKSGTQRRVSVN